MGELDNVVLQHLRAIRETLDNHTDRLLELQQRMGGLEVQVANMSVRLDRLDRVEKRLGLIEA
jgi:hypothetical protein